MGEGDRELIAEEYIMEFLLLKNTFIMCILFWAVLSLGSCAGFCLVAVSGGCCLVAVCGLLIPVASLVAEHRL